MGKNKLTSSQEEKLDKYLFQMFGLNSKQIETIIRERKELDFLNNYRGALSLWAEYTQDTKQKIIVTLDGRDTAGKGSNIKRVTEYFDIKRHNEVAFGIPTAKERFEDNWFKRYQKYFPKPGEVTFFDRSWYNRAGVEAAMGFCTEEEYNWFMANVSEFEKTQIIDKKIDFIKVYLSITKETQKFRLKRREQDMKRWKSSFIDKQAQEKWNYYTLAKANILKMTDSEYAPWMVLDSNEKWLSATEIIKAIINTSEEVAKIISKNIDLTPNPKIVRTAEQELERMQQAGDLDKMKPNFKFKQAA
ncbi:polyphosphate kinase 2 [Candidatus Gracilibacteria bacterium]|nr:polyphosphate kinase 2 [Candidatus Gracilibacteria bacterium]RKW22129.1 MAG: polyphosphate kinase 2 [Candidatus Gracilibacteria bacterium]